MSGSPCRQTASGSSTTSKGEVRFAPGALRDFVLVRSDGSPTFLLAVAVDDMQMGVTHVIRGEDPARHRGTPP